MDAEDFQLEYVDSRGELRKGPLEAMWPARFEVAGPVRAFPSCRGLRSFSGWYWAATGATDVGYESWVELSHLMRLDFVPLGHLLASEGFTVVSSVGPGRPSLPEEGVLGGLPEEAVTRAWWWQRHLTELLTGRPDGDPHAQVRAEYDPAVHSLRQRELTKLAELQEAGEDVGLSTLRGFAPVLRTRG
ncbi:hypothetical protein ACFVYF_27190 [Streptomyces sp. NPDC058274]|uniref:hypothetical protein n=1 Tax=Streptomyces sp. NPDC058274 TaxID=3346416 RepID=UPI0036EF7898